MHHVFIYGTIRRGQGNHHFVKGAEFLGLGIVPNTYLYRQHGLPFMSLNKEFTTYTEGEIYKVSPQQLTAMDYLEGHPDFYTRTPVTAHTEDGPVECETYLKLWPKRSPPMHSEGCIFYYDRGVFHKVPNYLTVDHTEEANPFTPS